MEIGTTFLYVPAGNIAAMVLTLCMSVLVPIVVGIVIFVKYKAKISSFFIGCASFIVFAMILEALLHAVVLQGLGSVSEMIKGNIYLYGLYGGLAAGIFEETGRYLSMRFLMKKNLNKENALMYGAGHGGIEAILIVGVIYINNIIYSIMINTGAIEGILDANMISTLSPLMTAPAWQFLIAGVERLLTITMQITWSVLVYLAISRKNGRGYFFLAVALHALSDFIVVVTASLFSTLAAEVVCLVIAAGTIVIVKRLYKREDKFSSAQSG